MGLLTWLANTVFMLLYKKEYQRFTRIPDIAAQQERILLELCQANKDTIFGKQHHFASMESVEDYRRQVPIQNYEAAAPFIERAANGEAAVLTYEPVLLFEPTSGSSSASKLIPYNASLKAQFQKGIRPWIFDLYSRIPEIRWGKSYWSITPAGAEKAYTSGGIPIGFEEDTQYFGKLEEILLHLVFAVDSSVAHQTDMEDFYFQTARALLNCKDLTLISIWNPSYLLLILDYIGQHRARLLETLPKRRARQVAAALDQSNYQMVWPGLRVISCWSDAAAQPLAQKLMEQFPDVLLQPKGLLATECFVSFPLVGEEGACLSINSHFFEFLPLDGSNGTRLAHQLELGGQYEVIVTTGGGLYRYRIYDRIQVVGFFGQIPRIRFIGRSGRFCDLYGEKLSEAFVEQAVASLGLEISFYMMAPASNRYILFIQTNAEQIDIDTALRINYHYDYCRRLGQLQPAQVFLLEGDPWQAYLTRCVELGQRLGDIKPVHLHLTSGWETCFHGHFI